MKVTVKDENEALEIGKEALRLLVNVRYYTKQWREKGGSVPKMNVDYWMNKTDLFFERHKIEKDISNLQDKVNFEIKQP